MTGRLLIGTSENCVYELMDGTAKYVMQGHSMELWGLAVHPIENLVVTAGG